jgi:hypothetical protein
MKRDPLIKSLNSAAEASSAYVKVVNREIDNQLSGLTLNNVIPHLNENDKKEINENIRIFLTEDAKRTKHSLYCRYIVQANFILNHYDTENPKAAIKELNDTLNSKSVEDLEIEAGIIKADIEKFKTEDGKSDPNQIKRKEKLHEIEQEFAKGYQKYQDKFLLDNDPIQDLETRIQRLQKELHLGKILDYGATSDTLKPISLKENAKLQETPGGMRSVGMNAIGDLLSKTANSIEALKNYNSLLEMQGTAISIPGTLKKQIEIINTLPDDPDTLVIANTSLQSSVQTILNSPLMDGDPAIAAFKEIDHKIQPKTKKDLIACYKDIEAKFDNNKKDNAIITQLYKKLNTLEKDMNSGYYPHSEKIKFKIDVLKIDISHNLNKNKIAAHQAKKSNSKTDPSHSNARSSLTHAFHRLKKIVSNQLDTKHSANKNPDNKPSSRQNKK